MKTISTFALALALLCVVTTTSSSCVKSIWRAAGSVVAAAGNRGEATIDLDGVRASALSGVRVTDGGVRLHLAQGSPLDIRVSNPYDLPIAIGAQGGTLLVQGISGNLTNQHADVYVTMPQVGSLAIEGSSDIMVDDLTVAQQQGDLKVTITGSGDLTAASLTARRLTLTVTGSGDIDVAGVTAADAAHLTVTGSGSVHVQAVTAPTLVAGVEGSGGIHVGNGNTRDATLRLAGSGTVDARLTATGTVDARQSGSGEMHLSGNIAHLNKSHSGSGNITYQPD